VQIPPLLGAINSLFSANSSPLGAIYSLLIVLNGFVIRVKELLNKRNK